MASFEDILNTPASDAEPPPLFPVGQYIAMVDGQPRQDRSSRKGTPFIEYNMKPISAVDGTVDEDALSEFGPLGERTLRHTFYFTENSAYRHKDFLVNDLKMDIDGMTHWEAAQAATGESCIITIKHSMTKDDKPRLFAEIGGTAPIEKKRR